MHPCEKNDRPCDQLMEGNVLIELDDAIQGCLSEKGDQRPADGEQNDGDIEVKDQGRGSSNGISNAER